MIMGEYAVIYGSRCVSTAIEKRLTVEVSIINKKEDFINIPKDIDSSFIISTLNFFRKKNRVKSFYEIKTKTDFSENFGFGSSSAVTISTLKSLYEIENIFINNDELFKQAFYIHKKTQTNGSGYDIATAIFGKTIFYKKEPFSYEYLPDISKNLIVAYSGIKAKTGPLIKYVEDLLLTNKVETENLINKIKILTDEFILYMKKNDIKKMGEIMNEDQLILKKLGVSTERIDFLVDIMKENGAFGAKLSGAGGGDCVIGIVETSKKYYIKEKIKQAGFQFINMKTNCDGIKTSLI